MPKIVNVRFRTAGKIYFFSPAEFELKRGDKVVVETARGIEYGNVVSDIVEVDEKELVSPLREVLRLASEEDTERANYNRQKEREAFKLCAERIRGRRLEMKLIDAEYTFDRSKLIFYFTADGRVDFRELVKDLAGTFKTRIELRQIGVRDETKIMGGYGICGRELCCHSYLSDFVPVSIRMAKEQNLSLNPSKISGVCGRLMCCLKNEEETYEYLNRELPNCGDKVTTADGKKGKVTSINVLRQLVKVLVEEGDEKQILEYPVSELKFRPRRQRRSAKHDIQELDDIKNAQELLELEDDVNYSQKGGADNRKERFLRPDKGAKFQKSAKNINKKNPNNSNNPNKKMTQKKVQKKENTKV